MSLGTEGEFDIESIISTIYGLRAQTINGFLPWRWVAKQLTGSAEYASVFSSMATMEAYKKYFVSGEKGVKLTEEGVRCAQSLTKPKLSQLEQIADSVRKYASRLFNIRLEVKRIAKVAQVGQRFVHAFYVDASDELLPSETPCEFRPENGSFTYGRLIGQEPDGGVLYVALDSEVFESSLPAFLSIDRAFLTKQLADRLRELKGVPVRMSVALQSPKASSLPVIAHTDSLQVAEKLAQLPTPWTRFLWGPPGAGKTFGLGYLVSRLQEQEPNGKTLIVAPSNRAVDVAMEQVVDHTLNSKHSNMLINRQLLRFGYPRKQQVLDCPELLGSPELDTLNNRVKSLASQIQKVERERNSQKAVAVLRTEMLAAQEAVKNAVEAHIAQCCVVATTTTLAYLVTSPISKFKWDNVIVDEVTMVTPAMCTFLASLAAKRFLLAGDPQQLGPVYEGNASTNPEVYEWMGRDIFEKSGISSGDGVQRKIQNKDFRLARITAQRRCTINIWTRVQKLYPQVDHLADEASRKHILALPPRSDSSVVLLDTSRSREDARCRKQYNSWENPFTAELALEVATTIAAEASRHLAIAIISPYRAQVRLLRKWIRQEQRAICSPFNQTGPIKIEVDAGTVHQFQGSDADVIIFDMVDGPPRDNIGQLLRDDTGMRLVNVAFTRAKGKLILIADRNWCKDAMRRKPNVLLEQLIVNDKQVVAVDVLPRTDIDGLQRRSFGCAAESLLMDALCRRCMLPDVLAGYILRGSDGTPLACADLAYPDARIAIFADGPRWSVLGNEWQRDWRQRHRFADTDWTFAVFSIGEVYDDIERCANFVEELYAKRQQKPPTRT